MADDQVVLGRGTTVGANTSIRKSVIGRDCKIGMVCPAINLERLDPARIVLRISAFVADTVRHAGDNVRIENAVLWDGVVVHNNSSITFSIVGHRAEILANTVISENCLLADDVRRPVPLQRVRVLVPFFL